MKITITKLAAAVVTVLAAAGAAQATLLQDSSGTLNEAIPDGNPVGIVNNLTVSDAGNAAVQDVSVNLNISGGYDGDLYGYLVYQPSTSASGSGANTSMIVLLNQIGTTPFGDPTSGMNVTLSDSGTGDIHDQTGTALTSGTGIFTPDSASTLDGTFGGQSADGTWTLFLADMTTGGGTGTLNSWGLNISVVPEPVTWALAGFALLVTVLRLIYWLELRTRDVRNPDEKKVKLSKGELTT